MQAELLQIAANAVTAKLIGASRDTKLLVSQMLSYEVEGAERNEQFRAGNWDGRSSFFDFRSETFPAGFVHMVGRELTKLGHRLQYAIKPPPKNGAPRDIETNPFAPAPSIVTPTVIVIGGIDWRLARPEYDWTGRYPGEIGAKRPSDRPPIRTSGSGSAGRWPPRAR